MPRHRIVCSTKSEHRVWSLPDRKISSLGGIDTPWPPHSTLKSLASWHDFETCVMANGGSKKHIVPRFHHDSILEAVTGLKSEICVISTFISLKTRIFPPWTRVVLACIVKRWPIFPASKPENPGGLSKNSDRKKFITPPIPGKNSPARPAAIVRQSE